MPPDTEGIDNKYLKLWDSTERKEIYKGIPPAPAEPQPTLFHARKEKSLAKEILIAILIFFFGFFVAIFFIICSFS